MFDDAEGRAATLLREWGGFGVDLVASHALLLMNGGGGWPTYLGRGRLLLTEGCAHLIRCNRFRVGYIKQVMRDTVGNFLRYTKDHLLWDFLIFFQA
jgi:hypothetical protein